MPSDVKVMDIMKVVENNAFPFEMFHKSVETFFKNHPLLTSDPRVIHSIKGRIKDYDHLKEKIKDKSSEDDPITPENIFEKITDIAGIRVMHLYQGQFPIIHNCIMGQVNNNDWSLFEPPKAYTWDPDSVGFFENLGLKTEQKESLYTSIHYVVKPKPESNVTCEIQVRTLFEEIWGEIDHRINYPKETKIKLAKEQIRILARLVGAGSRLGDAIFMSVDEQEKPRKNTQKKTKTRKTAKKKGKRKIKRA